MSATSSRRRRRTTGGRTAAPQARSFEEFASKSKTTPGRKCPRCKVNDKAGNVGVRLNRTEGGAYKQVTSRHIALCESCAVEVYEELVEQLEGEAGNGDE